MQRGFVPLLVLVGILVLAAVGGGAYFFGRSQVAKPQLPNPVVVSQTPQVTPLPSLSVDETANWKKYTNAKNKLSFKYPPDWQVMDNSQSAGTFNLLIKSPNQMIINYTANIYGVGGSCASDLNAEIGSDSIEMFQTPLNLFYLGDKEKRIIKLAYVIRESVPCPNIAFFEIPRLHGLNSITIYYGEGAEISDKNFKSTELETAKSILSTFQVDESVQDTSSWKSYSINGFSLKMPPQLVKFSQDNADYIFTSKTGSQFDVSVYPNKSMEELDKETVARFSFPQPPYKRKLILGGINSTEYYGCVGGDGCKSTFILLTNNQNKLFEIDFTISAEDLDFYTTILSTIKFPQ